MLWKGKVEEAYPIIIPEAGEKEEECVIKLQKDETLVSIISTLDQGTKLIVKQESSLLPLIAAILLMNTMILAFLSFMVSKIVGVI